MKNLNQEVYQEIISAAAIVGSGQVEWHDDGKAVQRQIADHTHGSIGFAFTADAAGEYDAKLKVTYEDADGQQQTKESVFVRITDHAYFTGSDLIVDT